MRGLWEDSSSSAQNLDKAAAIIHSPGLAAVSDPQNTPTGRSRSRPPVLWVQNSAEKCFQTYQNCSKPHHGLYSGNRGPCSLDKFDGGCVMQSGTFRRRCAPAPAPTPVTVLTESLAELHSLALGLTHLPQVPGACAPVPAASDHPAARQIHQQAGDATLRHKRRDRACICNSRVTHTLSIPI